MSKKCVKCGGEVKVYAEALAAMLRCQRCLDELFGFGLRDLKKMWNMGIRSPASDGHKDTIRVGYKQFVNNRDHYLEISKEKNIEVKNEAGVRMSLFYWSGKETTH